MTVALLVNDVPPAIRAAVEDDARKREVSVNYVVAAILAERYGVPWNGHVLRHTRAIETDDWFLRMPSALRDALRAHAAAIPNGSQRGCVLMAVAEHYGLPAPSPQRRRERAISPELVWQLRQRHSNGESIRSLAREYGLHRETLTKALRAA